MLQEEQTRFRKQTYGSQKGKVEGGDKLGVWNEHKHTTVYKIDHQQRPAAGNSAQGSVTTYVGKEAEKERKYVYAWPSHFAVLVKLAQHSINYAPK